MHDNRDPAPVISEARYAKGQMAASCPGVDGWKGRAARLAEHLKGRYSHRENAYIMSRTKAARLRELFAAGRDASAITRELLPEATV